VGLGRQEIRPERERGDRLEVRRRRHLRRARCQTPWIHMDVSFVYTGALVLCLVTAVASSANVNHRRRAHRTSSTRGRGGTSGGWNFLCLRSSPRCSYLNGEPYEDLYERLYDKVLSPRLSAAARARVGRSLWSPWRPAAPRGRRQVVFSTPHYSALNVADTKDILYLSDTHHVRRHLAAGAGAHGTLTPPCALCMENR
jgi:hypothetical protein